MDTYLMLAIAGVGAATLMGVFVTKKPGFGPHTLRAVGIVLVATLASLLAVSNRESVSAAMGILGAIAGYLFGAKGEESSAQERRPPKNEVSIPATAAHPGID